MYGELDHLIVAARTLDEGAAWIEDALGAKLAAGGKHALMGTHNRLLSLGPRLYLEVIAIDPEAPAPARQRWLALDNPAMQERLERSPALIHWVERIDNMEAALSDYPDEVEILSASRGNFRWRIGVRADGQLPGGGRIPTLIQWEGVHPAESLPASGCTLVAFEHGEALEATLSTPAGRRTMRGIGGIAGAAAVLTQY